jgi:hypothetical protein
MLKVLHSVCLYRLITDSTEKVIPLVSGIFLQVLKVSSSDRNFGIKG